MPVGHRFRGTVFQPTLIAIKTKRGAADKVPHGKAIA
jgi:hypothetical protein